MNKEQINQLNNVKPIHYFINLNSNLIYYKYIDFNKN